MRLDELMPGALVGPTGSIQISALSYDSRRVAPGALFFCVPGAKHDGHDHAAMAVRDGAVAVVVERPLGLPVPEIQVSSARAAMGPAAARFHRDPSERLAVIGITGTNGKTTTAFLVRALLEAQGTQCGLLGTVKSVIGGVEHQAERTTPEAIELQGTLHAMLDGGDGACAMEVSSHALALGRTAEVHFAAAIFTNLTQDHLDFHTTMEDYFKAKRALFCPPAGGNPPALSIVNIDDPYGRRLAGELAPLITFAIDRDADYRARIVSMSHRGTELELQSSARTRRLTLALPGRFNVYNALAALAVAEGIGGDPDVLIGALERGVRVPGRLEAVDERQDFTVLVDYAHTPDSLANVLGAARELSTGRVICVFGAGGDRDRGKRPLMGEIGARESDVLLITSDNPRSEDPEAIIAQIMAGAASVSRSPGAQAVQAITDRRVAIERVMQIAREGDVVVIAGKGHEQGQELAEGVKVPFDDVSVAREALRDRGLSRSGASA